MPYDLYWHGEFEAFHRYAEKYRLEQERREVEIDRELWTAGGYNRDALLSVWHLFNSLAGKNPKKIPYPKEPYLISSRKKKKQTIQEKSRSIYDRLLRRFPKKKGRDSNGRDN